MNDEKYITIKELTELKGVSTRAIRLSLKKYITREITVKGGKSFEILLSSIEPELQEKYYSKIVPSYAEKQLPAPMNFHKPDKAKVIALARLDLLNLWKNQRKNQQNKMQFDIDFLSAYNAQVLYPEIYAKIGKVSIGTLQRWKRILGNSNNYEFVIPNYHYEDYSRTCLTEHEKQIFLKLLLHPNKFSIGKAISLTQHVLKSQGQEYIPAAPTFRRFANWYKTNYFDKWTLLRDGEKALKEDVIPHIKRDISKIKVGEVLVADGKRLNFQVINPFTGKPCRATLIGFLDWKSSALVGYEIMIEEYKILKFAHKQRNKIYHENKIRKSDIKLTIILYYLFLTKKRVDWENPVSFRVFSNNVDDKQIDFGQGLIEETFPFNHEKYFFKTWDYIIQKWEIQKNLAITCQTNILNQIASIEYSIKYLIKTLEEYNYLYQTSYYSFVKEKDAEDCRKIDFILLVHMFYRLINENANCRKDMSNIRDFIKNNKKVYPKWVDINKIKKRVEKFNNLKNEQVFDNYIEIETRIYDLYQDSYDAMCYLDGYIQYLVDQYRGK